MNHITRFTTSSAISIAVLAIFAEAGMGGKIYAENIAQGNEELSLESAVDFASRHIKQQQKLTRNDNKSIIPTGDMPQPINAPQAKEQNRQTQKGKSQVAEQHKPKPKQQQAKGNVKPRKKHHHHHQPDSKVTTKKLTNQRVKHNKPQQKQSVTRLNDNEKSQTKQQLSEINSCTKKDNDGNIYLVASTQCDKYLAKIESEEGVNGELYLQADNGCTEYNQMDKRQELGGICSQLIAVTGYDPSTQITTDKTEDKQLIKSRKPKAYKAVMQWENHKAEKPTTQFASWDTSPNEQDCKAVLWKSKQTTTKYPWTPEQRQLLTRCKS